MSNFYKTNTTPVGYRCSCCGAMGVRLYRQYQTFADHIKLLCRSCALKDQNKKEPDMESEHTIGWLVGAVPTEDNLTYWGYTSVPQDGVEWWNNLPKSL